MKRDQEGGSAFKSLCFFFSAGVLCACVFLILIGPSSKPSSQTQAGEHSSNANNNKMTLAELAQTLAPSIQKNTLPNTIEVKSSSSVFKINYTINEQLQKSVEKLLGLYRPDYAAVVALDARTGELLVMTSYQREGRDIGNLAVRSSFPAASIFKIITAAAAVEESKLTSDSVIPFNGSYHSLYRKNVERFEQNRWTRYITLREAFAKSVNTVFGKLGLFYIGSQDLYHYAEKFYFNREFDSDLVFGQSQTVNLDEMQEDRWSIAEAASGFTLGNTLSPVHGAVIAATIAQEGRMVRPFIVNSVEDEAGNVMFSGEPKVIGSVIRSDTARELQDMMQATVQIGTSRKWFRQLLRKRIYQDAIIGGKTGSLTGLEPRGKYDWFVGFLKTDASDIAVAALTINEKVWRVKSSYLASELFRNYLSQSKNTPQDSKGVSQGSKSAFLDVDPNKEKTRHLETSDDLNGLDQASHPTTQSIYRDLESAPKKFANSRKLSSAH